MSLSWRPAIEFDKCYLMTYPGKGVVYITQEAYRLMGRPKKLVVFPMGKTICLSPAKTYGTEVLFNSSGQPYIVHPEARKAIKPGLRAYYAYDEEDYDFIRGGGTRRYFYFRVSNNVPAAPKKKPAAPAKNKGATEG